LAGLVALVPVYNAGTKVRAVLDGLLAIGCRTLVVDDGSTDHGLACAEGLPIEMLRFERNCGKGHSLLAGFAKALEYPDTGAIAVLDADGQHDPAELPHLFAEFQRQGADLLIGARDFSLKHVPFRSRFGNNLTARLTGWLLGARLADTQSGYRILSRRFAEAVVREIPGGRYETEMAMLSLAIRGDFTLVSAPIKTLYVAGNTTSHFRKGRDSWLIYRTLIRSALRRRK
jgi:glycosyltransferase involved in cell wall biosynthesis